jgi:hypothetical protein
MKTRSIWAGTLASAALVMGAGALQAAESFQDPFVVRGPYLQRTTPTSTIVRWRTEEAAGSVVRFGLTPDVLPWTLSDLEFTTDHSVTLTNLLPNTRYYYVVGTPEIDLAGGPDYFVRTAPVGAKPTRIWAIGDSGTASAGNFGSWLVRDAYDTYAGSRETDVWLMLGDNAYGVGTDYEYQLAVFDTYPKLLRRTAVWSTLGNHETYAPLPNGSLSYFDIFDFPAGGEVGGVPSGTERYYSFNHADIHFVCIDSELSARGLGSPMLTWLEADLAANTNEWVIAFWHSPPYTKGSHDSDNLFDNGGNMTQMRQNVNPILERYGVDLVLGGHSHNYERSRLLKGHYGFSTELVPTMVLDAGSGQEGDTGPYRKPDEGEGANQGTVYIVAGSSGWATFQTGFHPVMHFASLTRGSVVIDVDGRRMDVRYLRDTGAVDDRFTIVKGGGAEPLRIVKTQIGGGAAALWWRSIAGKRYQIEKSVAAQGAGWVPIGDIIQATGATSSWEDAWASADDQSFFRVVQLD